MHVGRLIKVQLVVFAVITVVAAGIMAFGYIKLPAMFGVGRYTVTMELPRSGGACIPAEMSPTEVPRSAR